MSSARNLAVVLVIALAFGAVACESRITGKEGNLQFAYYGAGDVLDFNKPIAVGANLDLRVTEAPDGADVTVLEVDFDPEGVLGATEIYGNTIVVEGLDHGRTEIRAEAELLDGEIVEDFIDMRARVATRLEVDHYCTQDRSALYLTEQEIWLPFSVYDDNDERLIGYGYRPVDFSPPGQVTLHTDNKNQRQLRIDTGLTPGFVEIQSTIDETSLGLELVPQTVIDGLDAEVGAEPRVNHTTTIHFQPLVQGERVCQPNLPFEIENLTPEICEVQFANVEDDSHHFQELGVVVVEGSQQGECTILGILDDVNNQQGVSTEASVTIQP